MSGFKIEGSSVAFFIAVAAGTLSLHPSAARATVLSGEAIAEKCYSKLTRQRQPAFRKYKDWDSKRAIDYCKSLVDAVVSGSDGRFTSRDASLLTAEEARLVGQTFYDFHRSWFKSTNWAAAVPGDAAGGASTYQDTYAPANYVTRALIEDRNYDSILSGTTQPYALRREGGSAAANEGGVSLREGCDMTGDRANFKVNGNSYGIIDGFRDDDRSRDMRSCSNDWQLKIGQSFGGGLIGASSYLQLNMGFSPFVAPFQNVNDAIKLGSTSDGGLRVARRWSKAVFNEVLCRDLPAARPADVSAHVQAGGNFPPFRSAASCLSCHSYMDPMAGTVRDLAMWNMFNDGTYIARYQGGRAPASDERPASDRDYFRRPPTGRLFFRSISGNLVDVPVEGLDALGSAIAATPDFYACAASRYLSFFSGTTIPLTDPNNQKDSTDVAYLKTLASDFKNHQKLKRVIKAIFESVYFTTTNRGT